jgi:hypothetical protein
VGSRFWPSWGCYVCWYRVKFWCPARSSSGDLRAVLAASLQSWRIPACGTQRVGIELLRILGRFGLLWCSDIVAVLVTSVLVGSSTLIGCILASSSGAAIPGSGVMVPVLLTALRTALCPTHRLPTAGGGNPSPFPPIPGMRFGAFGALYLGRGAQGLCALGSWCRLSRYGLTALVPLCRVRIFPHSADLGVRAPGSGPSGPAVLAFRRNWGIFFWRVILECFGGSLDVSAVVLVLLC